MIPRPTVDFTLDNIEAWAREQPPTKAIGTSKDPHGCVVARYANHASGIPGWCVGMYEASSPYPAIPSRQAYPDAPERFIIGPEVRALIRRLDVAYFSPGGQRAIYPPEVIAACEAIRAERGGGA